MDSDPSFYKDLLYHIRDGVYFVDQDRRIRYWNEGAARLTGYAQDEIIGRFCHDNILSHIDGCGKHLCENGCPLSAAIHDGQGHEASVFLRHKLGHRVPVSVRVQPIYAKDGSIDGAVEIFSDNTGQTEAIRKTEEMRRLAFLDYLTQLPNRRFLEMTLQTALTEYQVHQSPFGVMIIDVDGFKHFNDEFGHACGDRVLQEIGKTLTKSLRPSDVLGRWGGDEFVAVVYSVDNQELALIAERSVAVARNTEILADQNERIRTSVSIGASLIRPGENLESLLARADLRVYASKSAGRDRATTH